MGVGSVNTKIKHPLISYICNEWALVELSSNYRELGLFVNPYYQPGLLGNNCGFRSICPDGMGYR